jgi:hypothetical protein
MEPLNAAAIATHISNGHQSEKQRAHGFHVIVEKIVQV